MFGRNCSTIPLVGKRISFETGKFRFADFPSFKTLIVPSLMPSTLTELAILKQGPHGA